MRLFLLLKKTNFKSYSIFPNFFCLLITNNPLKLIIVAPITIFVDGSSFNIKYPKIIPNTITEYLEDAVNDNGA